MADSGDSHCAHRDGGSPVQGRDRDVVLPIDSEAVEAAFRERVENLSELLEI